MRTLDLGCGAGESTQSIGTDIDLSELIAAKSRKPDCSFVCSRGEELPFLDGSFDRVWAGVSIPYMNIRKAFSEIARVLKPGGQFEFTVHTATYYLAHELPRCKTLKSKAVRWCILLNGLCFNLFGFQLQRNGSYESFQTFYRLLRELERAGFQSVQISRNYPLTIHCMTAR